MGTQAPDQRDSTGSIMGGEENKHISFESITVVGIHLVTIIREMRTGQECSSLYHCWCWGSGTGDHQWGIIASFGRCHAALNVTFWRIMMWENSHHTTKLYEKIPITGGIMIWGGGGIKQGKEISRTTGWTVPCGNLWVSVILCCVCGAGLG